MNESPRFCLSQSHSGSNNFESIRVNESLSIRTRLNTPPSWFHADILEHGTLSPEGIAKSAHFVGLSTTLQARHLIMIDPSELCYIGWRP